MPVCIVVGELPCWEKSSKGQGKYSPKNYIVIIRLREVAKQVEEKRAGEARAYPALRFIMVSFNSLDGLF